LQLQHSIATVTAIENNFSFCDCIKATLSDENLISAERKKNH
jgi:hypothetical protein